MKGKRPYILNQTEELALLGYESVLLTDIRRDNFNKEQFLHEHATHVLEGLHKQSADEMIYGNGEKTKMRFLLDCSLRSKCGTKEDYINYIGNFNDVSETFTEMGAGFSLNKEKYCKQIIDPELDYENSLCDYYNLKFPIMEDESIKKIAEKILDKIIAGISERYGRSTFVKENTNEYDGKLKAVRTYIQAAICYCGLAHTNADSHSFLEFYFAPGAAAIMGALYQNNIFLTNTTDSEEDNKKWEQAANAGVDSYLKNEIMKLCAVKVMSLAKERKNQDCILTAIPREERIGMQDLNIHSIKRDIKDLPYEYFIQGMLATTVAVFMKYLAADNYIDGIKRELTKEARENTNTVTILKSELASITETAESLKKEKEELKTKLDKIQDGYDALPKGIQAENKRLKNENNELRKELYALKKKAEESKEDPKNKTANKLEQKTDKPDETVMTQEKIPNWIYEKKYVFLCAREDVVTRLKNCYPNSAVTETFNIMLHNAGTIDAVIALTRDICHSDYCKYKQKCANLNIPFIHCSSENMERIAADIFLSGVVSE